MLLSLNWLREFVPFEGSAQELGDRLTMLGLENEGIVRPFAEIEDLVVGHVLTCEQHPDADKLRVCKVDVGNSGEEPLNIVCGAPNVRAGLKVAVAPVGSRLPGDVKITKAKLRGVVSLGMICSERELGLSEDHSGIMELPEHFVPGARLVDALGLDQEVLEIGITPNRGDCLSVLGLAREVALAYNLPLSLPALNLHEEGDDASAEMAVEIASPDDCPAYFGRIVDDVKTAPSAAKVRYRLLAAGMRPLSNVVDVTNYIMLELGQPLHAFDMRHLEGGKIRVQRAEEGMDFITLDNQNRKLTATDLLIWDGVKPVALAGVMGGQNSEIQPDTSRVFLEGAVFDPSLVRRTARRLALPSDASYRFERGVDQNNTLYALNRAAALIAESAGGVVRPGVCGGIVRPWKERRITFSVGRCNDLLGVNLDADFCRTTLCGVGCRLENADIADSAWTVCPPSHRPDITLEPDLIEEIGRVYGLDRIEPTLPKVSRSLQAGAEDGAYAFQLALKRWAAGIGLNEAINYSFTGQKDLDNLNLPQEGRLPIANPLSAELDVMRTEIAPGLLATLRQNLAQGAAGVRVFELARAFKASSESETGAVEVNRLGLLLYGARHDQFWPHVQADADYQDVKGLVEHLAAFFKLGVPEFAALEEHPYMLPCVQVNLNGKAIGQLGRIKPDIADIYHARKDVWYADLNADALAELFNARRVMFRGLPQFPPVRRDITLICPLSLSVQEITDKARQVKMPLLEGVELIDVYAPKDGDSRNLTFRFTFRHAQRTLKDAEVDREREKMAEFLTKNLPVKI
ncbi:MAG: phenylalanine--tRNA ligase subunit beta [Desulfovibrionaceae bacterium]|nr:phenylalanine--tRNA ligase subunit beta [Desulfovibrionaceae bacterium]